MPPSPIAIIVAGAASHDPALLAEMQDLAVRLAASRGGIGYAAWYDQGRPTLADLLEHAAKAGATRIAVVPYLLQWRYPDHFSLPAQLRAFNARHPAVAVHLAAPLGLTAASEGLLAEGLDAALAATPLAELDDAALQAFTRQTPLPKRTPDARRPPFAHHVLICQGRACLSAGATELEAALRAGAKERGLSAGPGSIRFTRTRCLGPCAGAAVVATYPDGLWYRAVQPDQAADLLEGLLEHGDTLSEHRFGE